MAIHQLKHQRRKSSSRNKGTYWAFRDGWGNHEFIQDGIFLSRFYRCYFGRFRMPCSEEGPSSWVRCHQRTCFAAERSVNPTRNKSSHKIEAENAKTLTTIAKMQEGLEAKDSVIKRLQEEVTATHEKNALVSIIFLWLLVITNYQIFLLWRELISHLMDHFLANKEPYRVSWEVKI